MTDVNPFQFGALALDEAFTNREAEIAELRADVRNGQDVVVFAPRRYGKSSLVWRATQELARDRVLIASVDMMTTPTPAKLAEKLARAIHDDIASPLLRARERLRIFGDLKVTPTITIDPQSGAPAFSFSVTERAEDIDATIERLLELPAQLGADRKRQVALVLDEFQEVVDIDPRLPRLMRAVFQQQPEVGARLPRLQAPHAAQDLQRRERAVLAQRQADGARHDRRRSVRRLHRPPVRAQRALRVRRGDRGDPRRHRRAPLRDPGALLLHVAGDRARGARGGEPTSRRRWPGC